MVSHSIEGKELLKLLEEIRKLFETNSGSPTLLVKHVACFASNGKEI